MEITLKLITLVGIVNNIDAYGSGAPVSVCQDMTPQHGVSAQTGELSEIRLRGSEGLSKNGNFIYLLTASLNKHRLAWGPYARGTFGQLSSVPGYMYIPLVIRN
jgi:hypothetical protein